MRQVFLATRPQDLAKCTNIRILHALSINSVSQKVPSSGCKIRLSHSSRFTGRGGNPKERPQHAEELDD
jgi:hypothetical protein